MHGKKKKSNQNVILQGLEMIDEIKNPKNTEKSAEKDVLS